MRFYDDMQLAILGLANSIQRSDPSISRGDAIAQAAAERDAGRVDDRRRNPAAYEHVRRGCYEGCG
jgi:hypothetical protein